VQENGVPSGNASFSELGAEVLLLFKRIAVLGCVSGGGSRCDCSLACFRVFISSEYKFAVVIMGTR
jgi:hypothetical protein